MANRRMFSAKIINSARFLKMPSSTQALYFHLGMNADDDGIVEAFSIMRLIGSSEDDLKILAAKQFVIVLNDDLVTFVSDWLEHNLIRADRKVDSIYKSLLLQVVDNVKLIDSKPRSDRQQKDSDGTAMGQTMDGIGKDRLGKDRLGKGSIVNKPDKAVFDYNGFNDKEIESINLWLQYKKERKQSLTKTGLTALRNKLLDLQKKGQLVLAINNSMSNNWAGLFEDKIVSQVANKSQTKLHRANSQDYGDEVF